MPWLEITNEAYEALVQCGVGQYAEKHQTGWRVLLKWKTVERLRKYKFEGESLSDVIVRTLTKPS